MSWAEEPAAAAMPCDVGGFVCGFGVCALEMRCDAMRLVSAGGQVVAHQDGQQGNRDGNSQGPGDVQREGKRTTVLSPS